jgi:hypothetical protein
MKKFHEVKEAYRVRTGAESEDVVERSIYGKWVARYNVYRGVAGQSQTFKTRAAAIAWLEEVRQ